MVTPFGRLKLGTEFSSGSQLRINFEKQVSQNDLRQELSSQGYPNAVIRSEIKVGAQGDFIIRIPQLNDTEKATRAQRKFGNAT
jgi:preprotein translocase subunit SecF